MEIILWIISFIIFAGFMLIPISLLIGVVTIFFGTIKKIFK
jgi:hypothetical protein